MDDLISRRAAIDAVQQHRESVLGGYEYDECTAFVYAAAHNHIIDVIKHLPSAQQWIPWYSGELPKESGQYIVTTYDGNVSRDFRKISETVETVGTDRGKGILESACVVSAAGTLQGARRC